MGRGAGSSRGALARRAGWAAALVVAGCSSSEPGVAGGSATTTSATTTTAAGGASASAGGAGGAGGATTSSAGGAPVDGGASMNDCLDHTKDEAECKDCCDCLGVACATIVACRDACPLHDFSQNAGFVAVEAPSQLGPGGDYGACTALATEQDCKACCDCDGHFACGDQKYCRNACAGSAAYPPIDLASVGAPKLLVSGLGFAEGPLWDGATQTLLFSDIDADRIDRLAPPSTVTVFREPSHRANGLAFDPAGRLLVAEHGSRSVTRTLADGSVEAIASAWQGAPLNSPNDLVVRSDGTIYFTDPTYGLGPAPSDLGFTGLYRIDPAGALHLEAKIDGQPNGLDLAPDETALYVAATTANRVHRFAVGADGALSAQATYADVEAPDGLAVDAGGNLWIAALDGGQAAIVILGAKAKKVGSVPLGAQPTNVGFGGAGKKTLFVTARTAIYAIAAPIPGR